MLSTRIVISENGTQINRGYFPDTGMMEGQEIYHNGSTSIRTLVASYPNGSIGQVEIYKNGVNLYVKYNQDGSIMSCTGYGMSCDEAKEVALQEFIDAGYPYPNN